MKKSIKLFAICAAFSFALTSCIDNPDPKEGIATDEQIGESSSALMAAMNGIPAQMTQGYLVYGEQTHETDMGYPAYMIAQTELLGDMYPLGSNSGYDWYRNYNTFASVGKDTYFSYLPWRTFYMFVKSANDLIRVIDIKDPKATEDQLMTAGVAYACRAFDYYTLMTFFEPKANIYTDCDSVLGLTVPIIDENTTEAMGKNNPRVTHDQMVKFILSDLNKADSCLSIKNAPSKLFPSLACVYGIKARVFMWDEKYDSARVYARKAIDTFGGDPVTEAQWLDVNTGFNTANQAWMWKLTYSAETMGNLCNFTGWMSGEADWGYSSLSRPGIDKSLYDKISYNDFRKYTFLDPDRSKHQYKSCRGEEWLNDPDAPLPNYLSLKFRCGQGDAMTYSVGAAVDVPVMRVEEFYLIEAEAIGATKGVDAGKAALEAFVKDYRDPSYMCKATTLREFQLEVLTQMRIEFWGEGQAFAQAKRLQPNIVQNYAGTNAPSNIFKLNCYGMKPNWNFVIPQQEINGNKAIEGHNNPDPSGVVTGPTPVGTFAKGSYKADKNAQ